MLPPTADDIAVLYPGLADTGPPAVHPPATPRRLIIDSLYGNAHDDQAATSFPPVAPFPDRGNRDRYQQPGNAPGNAGRSYHATAEDADDAGHDSVGDGQDAYSAEPERMEGDSFASMRAKIADGSASPHPFNPTQRSKAHGCKACRKTFAFGEPAPRPYRACEDPLPPCRLRLHLARRS
ncbi:hypothetical protein LTR65_008994 [Meristemomyces frigidus]